MSSPTHVNRVRAYPTQNPRSPEVIDSGRASPKIHKAIAAEIREATLPMPVLPGMKPGGYYDQHSSLQRATVESLLPWVDQAVAGMTLPDEEQPFTIADYGCSEGSNSILAMGQVAAALLRRRPAQPVCGVHSDLPTNNFNRLFANLHDRSTSNYL